VRTTVNIHEGLLETVKQRAQQEGKTLGDVIELALRRYVALLDEPTEAGPPLPVLDTGGLLAGIDPTSNASIFQAIGDKNEDFARMTEDAAS
jgi:hypothetical protein